MGFDDDSDTDDAYNKKATSKTVKTPPIKIEVTSLVAQKILQEKTAAGPNNTEVAHIYLRYTPNTIKQF